jgi:hypothetical protein
MSILQSVFNHLRKILDNVSKRSYIVCMTDAIKIALALLGILALYALVGTVEFNSDPKQTVGVYVQAQLPTDVLERWCTSNPHLCSPADYKRIHG